MNIGLAGQDKSLEAYLRIVQKEVRIYTRYSNTGEFMPALGSRTPLYTQ